MKPFGQALVVLAAAVLLSLTASGHIQPALVQPPNVLVIVLDDLGTERLACYGQREGCPPTPELDKLRRLGVLFTNATSNPVCSPSRACIQTGRYAFRTGKGNNGFYSLRLSEVTLAEMLKAGFPGSPIQYTCGLFGKWHLTTLEDYGNVAAHGYDRFEGAMGNVTNHFNWLGVKSDADEKSEKERRRRKK
jgi:arylsulfatase A-like enzyme